ncbi:hypothetical protein BJ165DRAFT_1427122 [Panaeolus papilionaceus]|nr:hypothetical protein BJ165DRAFT_1427122 [Panaeolus papilionaceus]
MRAEQQHGQGAGLENSAGSPNQEFLISILKTIQEGAATGQLSQESLMLLSSEVTKIVSNPNAMPMPTPSEPNRNPSNPSKLLITHSNVTYLNHIHLNEPAPKCDSVSPKFSLVVWMDAHLFVALSSMLSLIERFVSFISKPAFYLAMRATIPGIP